jgi:hypothetical protein
MRENAIRVFLFAMIQLDLRENGKSETHLMPGMDSERRNFRKPLCLHRLSH